jgi:o-succinylbenzoate---CoA ligase
VDARAHLAGAGPGDLVAVSLPPGPAWMPLLEELWASGAAVLPLDLRLRPAEVASIVDRARPGLVLDADGGATIRTEGVRVAEGTGLVMATSGTSGIPKVVELSRGAVEAAVDGSAEALGIGASEPWLCCLSPAHVGGMLVLLRGVLTGAPVEVHPRFDPEAIGRARADHVSLVPTMLYRLLEAGADLARFRTILVGSAVLTDSAAEAARARGANVVTTYGLTETCGGVVYDGSPVGATGARLGPEGELQLAGPTVMQGYLGDPAATAAAFTLDGWVRTGDAGSIDDGVVTVHGRLDERIRTGAETVWPQEVEAALRDHPGIAEVAVAGRADPEWGEHVVAFVVPALVDEAPTLEELRDHAAEQIARFKVPRELVLLPELPRTASGKIRRAELR